MSTATAAPSKQADGRVFRGRSVDELIPKIEAELGPEAIVLRRRSGLEGGVGGFFQRPFVEIEARRGGPRVDIYDGGTEAPAPAAPAHPPLDVIAPHSQPPAASPADALAAPSQPQAFAPVPSPKAQAPSAAPMAPPLGDRVPEFSELELATLLGPVSGGEVPPARDGFSAALAAAGLQTGDAPTGAAATATAPTTTPVPARPAADIAARFAAVAETAKPVAASAPAPAPAPALAHAPAPAPAPTFAPAPAPAPAPAAPATDYATPAPAPAAAPAQAAPLTKTQATVERELIASGIGQELARELIGAAVTHVLPFSPRLALRKAVRVALQQRIPVAAAMPSHGGAIAFVGPGGSGKTRCVATLAGIYRKAEAMPVGCASVLSGETLRMMLSPRIPAPAQADSPRALRALAAARTEGLALIDTPSLSPAEKGDVRALAKLLAEIEPDRIVVALPATLSATAASQLLQALSPLKPNAVAITHADETDQIGVAVQAACEFGLAPEYVLSGCRGEKALARVDSAGLADRLLP